MIRVINKLRQKTLPFFMLFLIVATPFCFATPSSTTTATVIDKKTQKDTIEKLMQEMSMQEVKYSKRPRTHFIGSLSVKGSAENNYLKKWSKKIEEFGNKNYTKEILEPSLKGTLNINVTINTKGHLVDITISTSSDSEVLDNAAIKFVQLAAPFDPLPKEISEKYDQLNISRTIIFHKNSDNKFSSTSR